MNKREVQKRVLQNGKPLALNKFTWNEKTNTFSSNEAYLVLDFLNIDNCMFKTWSNCTFTTGYGCTFNTGNDCTFTTWFNCTFTTGYGCTFNTGNDCTFTTWFNCTFTTGYGCTFNTGDDCTFNTAFDCMFKTWSNCIFNTGFDCTFNTGNDCTFITGNKCVILRTDIYQCIEISNTTITLAPYNIKGFIENGIYSETNKPAIIADGILSEVINKKEANGITIYHVINYGESKKTYLIEINGIYSHGKTLKEAKDSFKYKISDRDTSKYKDLVLSSVITQEEAIKLYRTITGACELGTKYFVEGLECIPERGTIKQLIEITNGQYNHNLLVDFFK